jgi:predicted kinase
VKRLIVFSGPPCSGKSTLGAKLSTTWSIPHLELETIRARILPNSRNTHEDHMIAHRTMHLVAEVFLELGMNVIANAAYSIVEERRDLEELAARMSTPLYLIECRVSPQAAAQRNARRREQQPGYELSDERVLELVNTFPYYGRGLVVDSTDPLADCMAEIDDYLKASKPLAVGKWSAGIPVPMPALERENEQGAVESKVTAADGRRIVSS